MVTIKSVYYNDILYTEEKIDELYNIYLNNIIKLASVCKVELVDIIDNNFPNNHMTITYRNPYISTYEKSHNIGLSVNEIGTYWLFIIHKENVVEGYHRYNSLHRLVSEGKLENRKILCLNIIDDNHVFNHDIIIQYHINGELKEINCWVYKDCKDKILEIPVLLKDVMWVWKEKYNEDYPTSNIVNNYDLLMDEITKLE